MPAGRYNIGTDDEEEDEQPLTPVDLPAFKMAFAPVTNAEFRCFIEAQGYEDERWWVGETALRWLREGLGDEGGTEEMRRIFTAARNDLAGLLGSNPDLTQSVREALQEAAKMTEADVEVKLQARFGTRPEPKPQEWDNPRFNHPAQPVVGVTVFEAQVYCRWLSAQQPDQQFRLPTEAEWGAAARGSAARRWPWAPPLDPERWQINADPAHLRRTTPVGVFPASDTPEGLLDMAGNVWEWTASTGQSYPGAQKPFTDNDLRVLRGGSWSDNRKRVRCGARDGNIADFGIYYLGFRVVVAPRLAH